MAASAMKATIALAGYLTAGITSGITSMNLFIQVIPALDALLTHRANANATLK
jgi:hypothetical protein